MKRRVPAGRDLASCARSSSAGGASRARMRRHDSTRFRSPPLRFEVRVLPAVACGRAGYLFKKVASVGKRHGASLLAQAPDRAGWARPFVMPYVHL